MGKIAEISQGTPNVREAKKNSYVSGRTVGTPKLSEGAAKYYEELKKKYFDMEFILVSDDQKEAAKAQAGKYSNASKMVVLIDESKIERMAEDENYRKQYESIISNGRISLKQMAQKLQASGISVKSFGMQVKDNRASFFAAVDSSFKTQRKMQQKRIEEKKAAKKAEEKKAQEKKAQKKDAEKKRAEESTADTEIISASSIEELIQKLQDYQYARMSDNVQTEEEKLLGQHIDFGV